MEEKLIGTCPSCGCNKFVRNYQKYCEYHDNQFVCIGDNNEYEDSYFCSNCHREVRERDLVLTDELSASPVGNYIKQTVVNNIRDFGGFLYNEEDNSYILQVFNCWATYEPDEDKFVSVVKEVIDTLTKYRCISLGDYLIFYEEPRDLGEYMDRYFRGAMQ